MKIMYREFGLEAVHVKWLQTIENLFPTGKLYSEKQSLIRLVDP